MDDEEEKQRCVMYDVRNDESPVLVGRAVVYHQEGSLSPPIVLIETVDGMRFTVASYIALVTAFKNLGYLSPNFTEV